MCQSSIACNGASPLTDEAMIAAMCDVASSLVEFEFEYWTACICSKFRRHSALDGVNCFLGPGSGSELASQR
jgi:hypothetical protein